jgi:hypothetical protein
MRAKNFISFLLLSFLLIVNGCKKTESLTTGEKGLQHTKKYSAEVANEWFKLLTHITRTTPYAPPQSIRIFVYAGMALYESVVPGMPSYQSIYKYLTSNSITVDKKKDYHWPAAANAAIARIASRILENYTAMPNLNAIQQLESSFNNQFLTVISSEQLQFSNDFGKYVADKIYDWSTSDGTLNANGTLALCPPYLPLGGVGNWIPTPPGFFPAAGACQGSLRTFIPGVVNVSLPLAPPAYSTNPNSAFYEMAKEVYDISLSKTLNDSLLSEAWRDRLGINYNAPSHMLKLTSDIIKKEELNLEDASVIYAKECIAIFDAVASVFYAKFNYSLLRPITYIRNVMGYTTWNSQFPTPQHPSYPAAAPGAAASATIILENFFGSNYSFVDTTQQSLYGSWSYSSFDGLLQDVGRSRTHSGLNFKLAVTIGINQGRQIGTLILNLPFKKE